MLFILALRGLSSQETAQRGNIYGIVGMAIAIAATFTYPRRRTSTRRCSVRSRSRWSIGAALALRVGMTQMPELVALLHSFVGLAAVLVGFSLAAPRRLPPLAERIEIYIDVIDRRDHDHGLGARVPQAARFGVAASRCSCRRATCQPRRC